MKLIIACILIVAAVNAIDVCDVCLKTVDEVVPKTAKSVAISSFYLERFCGKLPTEHKEKCLTYVKDNADMLFQKLNSESGIADTICSALHLCEYDPCNTCKAAAHNIKKMIPKNLEDVHNMEPILLKLCERYHQITGVNTKECKKFVHSMLEEAIKLKAEKNAEQLVCKDLGLCM
ncbi:hypothetical protein RCL1_007188 [Eukaryota sp. TZLM3-RCL]